MGKLLFILFGMVMLGTSAIAQDKVYRKNGQVLKVKILEVSSTEIKYKLFDQPEGPVYVLEKDRIKKIEYQDGRTETSTIDLKDPEQYADQKTKALKLNFFGPLFGYSQISFEKSTGVGKSYELGLAVIGAGKNQRIEYYDQSLQNRKRDQFGVAVSAGYKFNKLPDFLFGKTRFTHIMQGTYVKPVLYVGNYSENRLLYKSTTGQYTIERQNITFGALQLELGKQWVFGDQFLLDIYGGFGYGIDNKKGDQDVFDDLSGYNYLNLRAGRSPGFSMNFSLKLGMLIK